jgi:hypothetical protein
VGRSLRRSQVVHDVYATTVAHYSAIKPTTAGCWPPKNTVSGTNTRSFFCQVLSEKLFYWWTSSGTDRERSSTSARGAELLPKIRVQILISGDSLPDSSCRPGLCHCVSTVFGRFLEPRLRGFALSALETGSYGDFLPERVCQNPNSSLKRSFELVVFLSGTFDCGQPETTPRQNLYHLTRACPSALFNVIFVSIKATLANPTCQSPDGRASAGLIPRALRT